MSITSSGIPDFNPTITRQNFAATDCDEYSLTTPQTQWKSGRHEEQTTFEIVVRRLPRDYGYLFAGGLADCLDFLESFRYTDEELETLSSQLAQDGDSSSGPLYDKKFIEYLRTLHFTGEVYAVPEGTAVGPGVPILRVVAPRIQATIVEAALLATINQGTSALTEASRLVLAARGVPVWDGSARRNPGGIPSALAVARAAYIAGFTGTSLIRARTMLGIPTTGTMMHAEVQSWGEDNEQACFESWLRYNPHRGVLLVDTYDTCRGVERAIAASIRVHVPIKAIRIDSGDIAKLCRWARTRLDAAGMTEVGIMLSGDLDEYKIDALVHSGVPVSSFLVGTYLANPKAGPLGVVYKLTEQKRPDPRLCHVMKRAVGKATDPGTHRVWRDKEGREIIALADELVPGAQQLLVRVMALGRVEGRQPSLEEMRAYTAKEQEALPKEIRRLDSPEVIRVVRTRRLWELRASLGCMEAEAHLARSPHAPSEHVGVTEIPEGEGYGARNV